MEYDMQHVLFRDQRTARTRWYSFGESPTCICAPMGNPRKALKCAKLDSSLYSNVNCHNQYCSEFKRLHHQTEVGCEGLNFNEDQSEKPVRHKVWSKRIQNVLLLLICLSLAHSASALPTTTSSRSILLRRHLRSLEMASSTYLENLDSVNIAANSAHQLALELQRNYTNGTGQLATKVMNKIYYEWLPTVPNPLENKEDFKNHWTSGEIEFARDMLYNITAVNATVQVIIEDQTKYPTSPRRDLYGNFSAMRGMLNTLKDDLLQSLCFKEPEPQLSEEFLRELAKMQNLSKEGDRSTRDWVFINTLVGVLDFAVAGFQYFANLQRMKTQASN
ncbi:uncharacterized protein [Euwallacea fornicatus]|uniref:uncharacterized protein n=1 Tax=Euwallacea fornicatus TaxID=995702 RepID=UPI00338F79A3